jgi:thiol-disulfide isomerase/thioredoxin
MRILKVLCLALALMLCGAALAEGAPTPAEVGAEVDFTLKTLDGEEFRLSENRGKVVYLNIWATWCPPCVAEIPDIQKLAEAHPDELIVVGASVDETSDVVADFIEEKGLTYLIGMDEDYRLIDAACEVLYGKDGRGGLYSLVGWPADAIYHHYLALRTWEEVGELLGYSPSHVKRMAAAALDYCDANGPTWTELGRGMAT